MAPLGEDGGAGDQRIAGHDDAHRLPAGVHLDGLDGEGGGGRHPHLLAIAAATQDVAMRFLLEQIGEFHRLSLSQHTDAVADFVRSVELR